VLVRRNTSMKMQSAITRTNLQKRGQLMLRQKVSPG
jgi:hypothetical protein